MLLEGFEGGLSSPTFFPAPPISLLPPLCPHKLQEEGASICPCPQDGQEGATVGRFMTGMLVCCVSLIKCISKTNYFYKEFPFGPWF